MNDKVTYQVGDSPMYNVFVIDPRDFEKNTLLYHYHNERCYCVIIITKI